MIMALAYITGAVALLAGSLKAASLKMDPPLKRAPFLLGLFFLFMALLFTTLSFAYFIPLPPRLLQFFTLFGNYVFLFAGLGALLAFTYNLRGHYGFEVFIFLLMVGTGMALFLYRFATITPGSVKMGGDIVYYWHPGYGLFDVFVNILAVFITAVKFVPAFLKIGVKSGKNLTRRRSFMLAFGGLAAAAGGIAYYLLHLFTIAYIAVYITVSVWMVTVGFIVFAMALFQKEETL